MRARDLELLNDLCVYRALHPKHGRNAIAAALVDKHGRMLNLAAPRAREKAIEALRKRIERLEEKVRRGWEKKLYG